MNGTFKTTAFEPDVLKSFAADLVREGIAVEETWKKGSKVVENPEDANTFYLELQGQKIFQLMNKNGMVKPDHIPEEVKPKLYPLLKKYHFFSDPNWGLGIGLIVLFVIIELLIIWSKNTAWVTWVLGIGSILAIQWLIVSWYYCQQKISKEMYKFSMVIGMIGYLSTVAWSLLLLPMVKSCTNYYLIEEVRRY